MMTQEELIEYYEKNLEKVKTEGIGKYTNMQRKNIIILTKPGANPEPFGNFKKLCLQKCFPYHSLKSKSFPIIHGEFTIYKSVLN